ncbi:MAG TPA: 50S ribosomal protein L24 [Acidimicrobiales bacterium]|jgi:large subunit ribosomal protein L24|nr:50S ribosomal protein L24 [Acidimicrobiales bacterium]
MSGLKIRKGDRVQVLTGKDKGKEGVVSRVIPERNRVIVDGINVARRHQKARNMNEPGGIIDKDMPIHVSNLALISPKDGRPTRVGYKINDDGTKVRVCRRTGAEL